MIYMIKADLKASCIESISTYIIFAFVGKEARITDQISASYQPF